MPVLMSMKSGTRIRTYKPVVYKPSEHAIVVSDKNNDRKFMFLSEETKPDYRPVDQRPEIKPSPQMDHRPLGAESYHYANTAAVVLASSVNSSGSSKTARNNSGHSQVRQVFLIRANFYDKIWTPSRLKRATEATEHTEMNEFLWP